MTAASMHDTASAYEISAKTRCTSVPAVPPMKISGMTLPPKNRAPRLRAIANIFPTRAAISRPMPIVDRAYALRNTRRQSPTCVRHMRERSLS